MKKVFVLFLALILSVNTYNTVLFAQDADSDTATTEQVEDE